MSALVQGDVFTTGATMNECTHLASLGEAGAGVEGSRGGRDKDADCGKG